MIPKPIWLSALGKKSFTAMATALLPAVFSPDELLNSNVHGGVSRVNKNAERKMKLNEDKLNAIRRNYSNLFYEFLNETVKIIENDNHVLTILFSSCCRRTVADNL